MKTVLKRKSLLICLLFVVACIMGIIGFTALNTDSPIVHAETTYDKDWTRMSTSGTYNYQLTADRELLIGHCEIGGNVTIDLNGYTLTLKDADLIVGSGKSLTIKDTSVGKSGKVVNYKPYNVIEDSNIPPEYQPDYYPFRTITLKGTGSFTLNGGTIDSLFILSEESSVANPRIIYGRIEKVQFESWVSEKESYEFDDALITYYLDNTESSTDHPFITKRLFFYDNAGQWVDDVERPVATMLNRLVDTSKSNVMIGEKRIPVGEDFVTNYQTKNKSCDVAYGNVAFYNEVGYNFKELFTEYFINDYDDGWRAYFNRNLYDGRLNDQTIGDSDIFVAKGYYASPIGYNVPYFVMYSPGPSQDKDYSWWAGTIYGRFNKVRMNKAIVDVNVYGLPNMSSEALELNVDVKTHEISKDKTVHITSPLNDNNVEKREVYGKLQRYGGNVVIEKYVDGEKVENPSFKINDALAVVDITDTLRAGAHKYEYKVIYKKVENGLYTSQFETKRYAVMSFPEAPKNVRILPNAYNRDPENDPSHQGNTYIATCGQGLALLAGYDKGDNGVYAKNIEYRWEKLNASNLWINVGSGMSIYADTGVAYEGDNYYLLAVRTYNNETLEYTDWVYSEVFCVTVMEFEKPTVQFGESTFPEMEGYISPEDSEYKDVYKTLISVVCPNIDRFDRREYTHIAPRIPGGVSNDGHAKYEWCFYDETYPDDHWRPIVSIRQANGLFVVKGIEYYAQLDTTETLYLYTTYGNTPSTLRLKCKIFAQKANKLYRIESDEVKMTFVPIPAPSFTKNLQEAYRFQKTVQGKRTLSVEGESVVGDVTYQWQKKIDGNWTNVNGETTKDLTISIAENDVVGTEYRCVLSDGNKTSYSKVATVTIVDERTLEASVGRLQAEMPLDSGYCIINNEKGLAVCGIGVNFSLNFSTECNIPFWDLKLEEKKIVCTNRSLSVPVDRVATDMVGIWQYEASYKVVFNDGTKDHVLEFNKDNTEGLTFTVAVVLASGKAKEYYITPKIVEYGQEFTIYDSEMMYDQLIFPKTVLKTNNSAWMPQDYYNYSQEGNLWADKEMTMADYKPIRGYELYVSYEDIEVNGEMMPNWVLAASNGAFDFNLSKEEIKTALQPTSITFDTLSGVLPENFSGDLRAYIVMHANVIVSEEEAESIYSDTRTWTKNMTYEGEEFLISVLAPCAHEYTTVEISIEKYYDDNNKSVAGSARYITRSVTCDACGENVDDGEESWYWLDKNEPMLELIPVVRATNKTQGVKAHKKSPWEDKYFVLDEATGYWMVVEYNDLLLDYDEMLYELQPYVAPGCDTEGQIEHYTYTGDYSKYVLVDEVFVQIESVIIPAKHTLESMAGKNATCLDTGLIDYWTCSVCEKMFADRECTQLLNNIGEAAIEALGHEFVWVIDTPATKTTTGLKHEACIRCSETRSLDTVIPIITCDHENKQKTERVAPTCTSFGKEAYWVCEDCNKYFSDEACANEIADIEKYGQIAKADHDFEWVVDTPATKTTTGLKHEKCKNCEETRSLDTVIPVLTCEHENKQKTERVAPTCTSFGKEEYWVCEDCNKYFSNEDCTDEIADINAFGQIAKADHDFEWVVDTPATKTATGLKHEKCKNCEETRSLNTVIPVVTCDHENKQKTERVAPTCTATGKEAYWHCADCGKYFSDEACQLEIADIEAFGVIAMEGHDYQWIIDKDADIGVEGKKHEECTVCHDKKADVAIPALTYKTVIEGTTATVTLAGDLSAGVDVKAILSDPALADKDVVIKVSDKGSVKFNAAAVTQLISGDVVLYVKEGNVADHEGAELVLEISINAAGVTFTGEGKAVVTYAFAETAPEGKVAKVFYINGTEKEDMNATFEDGAVTFETTHFSTYVVEFVGGSTGTDPDPIQPTEEGGLPVGAIIAIVIGGVIVLGVGGFAIFWFVIKKKTFADLFPKKEEQEEQE